MSLASASVPFPGSTAPSRSRNDTQDQILPASGSEISGSSDPMTPSLSQTAATRPIEAPENCKSGSQRHLGGLTLAESNPPLADSMTALLDEGRNTDQYFGSSSAGAFTQQVKAAIDARLGWSSTNLDDGVTSTASGDKAKENRNGIRSYPGYVLPSRTEADSIMPVYWQYVDPLYPILDKKNWDQAYHDIYAGTPAGVDEHIFVATLEVILALSIQQMESMEPHRREESSRLHFRRAQDLLQSKLWDAGSIEVVQCLLLTSQYLQSTNKPNQTWMVVGVAIRTAQSLGLHLSETSTICQDPDRRELLRKVWHDCVLMDRYVSSPHKHEIADSHLGNMTQHGVPHARTTDYDILSVGRRCPTPHLLQLSHRSRNIPYCVFCEDG